MKVYVLMCHDYTLDCQEIYDIYATSELAEKKRQETSHNTNKFNVEYFIEDYDVIEEA